MKQFHTQRTIAAKPETVWTILTDVAGWPDWDPFCDRVEGHVEPGRSLKVYSKLSPGRAFPIRVTELAQPTRMVWTGGMPLGLFKGVRTFEITPNGDGSAFSMTEIFSGPMLVLIGRSLPDMSEAFDAFSAGLKARAEAAENGPVG